MSRAAKNPALRCLLITLIVVLLVLLIVPLFPVISNPATKASIAKTKAIEMQLTHALEMYRTEIGPFDTLDNHQVVSRLNGTNNAKHLTFYESNPRENTLTDAWGHDFRFLRRADGNLTVWSAGPNGVFEDSPGADDIRSE